MNFLKNKKVVRIALVLALAATGYVLLSDRQERAEGEEINYSQARGLIFQDAVKEASFAPLTGRLVMELKQPLNSYTLSFETASATAAPEEAVTVEVVSEEEGVVVGDVATSVERASGADAANTTTEPAVVASASEEAEGTSEEGNGVRVFTILPPGDENTIMALAERATLEIAERKQPSALGSFLMMLVPITIMIVFIYFFFIRKGSGGIGGAMGFGKNKAKKVDPDDNKIRMKDVAGCDEAKAEVAEIVDFLRDPSAYRRVNAKMPRGILLVGPPGTGKTLLAKAMAGEANVPFFTTSGSEFVEMFVGVGASRVRDMFDQARKESPSILFIDEIDAIGGKRNRSPSGGNDEREQTLNQILVEMDGFRPDQNVIVIAATNRADMLDEALRRPGRFDREVSVGLPDLEGRVQILKVHSSEVPMHVDIDWTRVARGTVGFSGAELANLINEAALRAARQQRSFVEMEDLEWARDRVMMGAEKQGGLKNERERVITAYHEAGHAVVARLCPHADPVHKVTIMPRGRALGLTMQLPREDSYSMDQVSIHERLLILMAGRAAEDVALGVKTTGASNDFARAENIARNFVGSWGLDPEIGVVSVNGERGAHPGYDQGWSDTWKQKVDNRVSQMLNGAYDQACQMLKENAAFLEELSQLLLKNETVDADEFEKLAKRHTTMVQEAQLVPVSKLV